MAVKSPITLCGSLSRHPVALGAAMHNAAYAALGLPFTYVPFATEDLAGALCGMRALGIRGFGVSMPFKLEVIPLLDRLDTLAQRIGAVNTIVNDDGALTGYNTDAWGAARALEEAMPLGGRRALVIGAGGAARAVVHALCAEGMRVHVANRTPEKATALAREVDATVCGRRPSGGLPDVSVCGRRPSGGLPDATSEPTNTWSPIATASGLEVLADLTPFDALVNCSSAGMIGQDEGSPLTESALRPELVVMDIVYAPIETELVQRARRVGAKTIHGGRMLLHQAARQFELYTSQPAPLRTMDEALRRSISAAVPFAAALRADKPTPR